MLNIVCDIPVTGFQTNKLILFDLIMTGETVYVCVVGGGGGFAGVTHERSKYLCTKRRISSAVCCDMVRFCIPMNATATLQNAVSLT